MKYVLHYAKKDLARHWLLALLVLVTIAFDAVDVRYGLIRWQIKPFDSGILLAFLKWPICFLFAVAITQEDVVVGEKSFWLTRPVHPLALLGSKLVSIFGVVVAPQTLAHFALCLALDTPPVVAKAIVVESLTMSTLVVLVAMLFAALSRSVLQACLLVVVSGIAAFTVGLLYENYAPTFLKWVLGYSSVSVGTRFVAVAVFLGLLLPALLAQHYVRRRVARTALSAVVVAGCATVLACVFPFQVVPHPHGSPEISTAPTPQPTKVSFKIAGDAFPSGAWRRYDRVARESRNQTMISLPVRADFDRNDRLISLGATTTTIHYRDGHEEVREAVSGSYFTWRQQTRALYSAAGLTYRDPETDTYPAGRLALFAINPGSNPIPPGRPADLTVRMEYFESEFRLAQRVPFKTRTTFTLGGLPYVIDQIETTERGVPTVSLRSVTVTSLLHPADGARPDGFSARSLPYKQIGLMLRNPTTNEIAVGGLVAPDTLESAGIFAASRTKCVFGPPVRADSTSKRSRSLDSGWLANAELLVYTIQPVGKSEQTLQLKNVTVAIEDQPPVQFW